jgi:Na+-transporting methylmalonyl-CoA/oxaloacetate decarboxylase gamma subunit
VTTLAVADKVISIIGTRYFQLIADLLGTLLKQKRPRTDAVSSGYYEGAYVVAILLLLIAAVESMAARDRHFSKKSPTRKRTSVPEYMKEIYRYRGYERLSELYVIRDAIIHNHVWVLDFLERGSAARKLVSAHRVSCSGDNRLTQRLNLRTLRTKLLRINAIPSRMDRRDLLKAFDVVISVLRFLEKRGANPVHILWNTVAFQRERVPFSQLREKLANAL